MEEKLYWQNYKKTITEASALVPLECRNGHYGLIEIGNILGYTKEHKFHPLKDIIELNQKMKNFPPIPLICSAKCTHCEKEILIFDISKHGYNALTTNTKYLNNYKMQKKSSCRKCKNDIYKVHVKIDHMGKDDVLQEGSNVISEENWVDAFDWITIDIECSKCGNISKSWVNLEVM